MALIHKVFVYGTLKRGQPNTHLLTNGVQGTARFVSRGLTKERYPMVIAGPFNCVFCLNKPGFGEHILGELYEVDDSALASLDVLEDAPRLYQRLVKAICLEDKTEIEAQMYLLCDYKESLLSLPYLKDYDSKGDHKLQYITHSERDKTRSKYEVLKSFRCLEQPISEA